MSFVVHHGDALAVLRTLPDESVDMCLTSPPYWGLRRYGVAGREIGQEKTPDEYVANLVEVFREVRRLLKPEGVLWLNLGDCYNAHPGQRKTSDKAGTKQSTSVGSIGSPSRYVPDLKPKDLIGIPWMVAFALRSDGWYLRQQCPWVKRNGLCESVKDRPTTSTETVFLLTKNRRYLYNYEAVAKRAAASSAARLAQPGIASQVGSFRQPGKNNGAMKAVGDGESRARRNTDWFFESLQGLLTDEGGEPLAFLVNTLPNKEEHFACMPITLAEPCILASSPVGGTCIDPFNGIATTGMACLKTGRNYIGIELNRKYVDLSYERARREYPLFVNASEEVA